MRPISASSSGSVVSVCGVRTGSPCATRPAAASAGRTPAAPCRRRCSADRARDPAPCAMRTRRGPSQTSSTSASVPDSVTSCVVSCSSFAEPLQHRDREAAEPVRAERADAQPEQRAARLEVVAGPRQQSLLAERHQDAQRRRSRHAEPPRDLRRGERRLGFDEELERLAGASEARDAVAVHRLEGFYWRRHPARGVRPAGHARGQVRKERVGRHPHQRVHGHRQHRALAPRAEGPEPHHVAGRPPRGPAVHLVLEGERQGDV